MEVLEEMFSAKEFNRNVWLSRELAGESAFRLVPNQLVSVDNTFLRYNIYCKFGLYNFFFLN